MAALQASLLLCKPPLSSHSSPKQFSPIRALDRPFRASDLCHSNLRRSRSRVASVPCSVRPENNPSSDPGSDGVAPEKRSLGNSAAEEAARGRNQVVVFLMAVGVAITRVYQKVLAWVDLNPLVSFLKVLGLVRSEETELKGDGTGKTFKDVKGCDEAKRELEEVVEFLKNPEKFTRLGGKLPKGILLQGAPGTGKTLLAKAIAGEAGVPLLLRTGSEFEEMFVGVGSRRVRSLFKEARKKAPCIIFIDEIDTVGSNRRKMQSWYSNTLNQLLAEMDGFKPNEGIILIAATNLADILDPALTRPGRFDRHIVVPSPDVKGRQEILELYLQDKPLGDDIDVKSLARGTPGFNGADLENLINVAAIRAAVEGAYKISAAHMEFAKDRIRMGTARKSRFLSEETKKLTAYHESGHAIVALNSEGADPIHKVTIVPHGSSLGMVSNLPENEEMPSSKKQLLAHIDVCMGGRAAEELIFGKDYVTTGANRDLEMATHVARFMVSNCGMSDEIGPVHVKERRGSEIQSRVDAEVVKFLREAYDRVKVLLKKHEKSLHTLANALLEHETLDAEEIKQTLLPDTGGQVPEQREEPVQQVGDVVPA